MREPRVEYGVSAKPGRNKAPDGRRTVVGAETALTLANA